MGRGNLVGAPASSIPVSRTPSLAPGSVCQATWFPQHPSPFYSSANHTLLGSRLLSPDRLRASRGQEPGLLDWHSAHTNIHCLNERMFNGCVVVVASVCRDNKSYFITALTKRLRHRGARTQGGNPHCSHRGWRALAARPGRRMSAGQRGRACSPCSAAPRVGSFQTRLMLYRAARRGKERYLFSRNHCLAVHQLGTIFAHILVHNRKIVLRDLKEWLFFSR